MNCIRKIRQFLYGMTLNKVLAVVAALIASVILVATVFVFAAGKTAPGKHLRNSDPSPEQIEERSALTATAFSSYTALGRLRAVTLSDLDNGKLGRTVGSSENGTVVVVSPWFSYTAGDTVFYEELSRKTGLLKGIVQNYFSRYTESQLRAKGEEKIKSELCDELNENLSLNKIKAVYFSEYIFLN